jgi:hypothetical protein
VDFQVLDFESEISLSNKRYPQAIHMRIAPGSSVHAVPRDFSYTQASASALA